MRPTMFLTSLALSAALLAGCDGSGDAGDEQAATTTHQSSEADPGDDGESLDTDRPLDFDESQCEAVDTRALGDALDLDLRFTGGQPFADDLLTCAWRSEDPIILVQADIYGPDNETIEELTGPESEELTDLGAQAWRDELSGVVVLLSNDQWVRVVVLGRGGEHEPRDTQITAAETVLAGLVG